MYKFKTSFKKDSVTISKLSLRKNKINEFEIKVFEKENMEGFFIPKIKSKHKIEYTAPRSIALSKYIKKNMSVHKFYNIIAQTIEVAKKIKLNKLTMDKLLIDIDMVYISEIIGELYFIYEPITNNDNETTLLGFFEEIISRIKIENKELIMESKRFHKYIMSIKTPQVRDFEQYILDNYPEIYQQISRIEIKKKDSTAVNKINKLELSQEKGYAELINKKTGDKITISKESFYIGKDDSADLVINNNKAISRKHATIYYIENEFYIVDENSTNHTYVNEQMINTNRKILSNGDTIKFADEEYTFTHQTSYDR